MGRFVLEIDTSSFEVESPDRVALARALKDVTWQVRTRGLLQGFILDVNGNKIGRFQWQTDQEVEHLLQKGIEDAKVGA